MTNTQETVQIPSSEPSGPTLEESLAELQKEGLVSEDGDVPGANTDTPSETQTEPKDPDRPEWLPKEFKTPEEMAARLKELEEGKPSDDAEGDGQDNAGPEVTPEERKAAEDATKKAGLDLGEVSKEWYDNEGLTEETYDKLEKAGYPREMVDVYIDGLVSRTNSTASEAYELVGGEEQYGEMIDWAIDNLSPEQEAEFDAAINSNNSQRALQAIKALKADYESAMQKDLSVEPEEQVDAKGGNTSGNVYTHMDEYEADLNDPRYDTNEAFRAKVIQKLDRSNIM